MNAANNGGKKNKPDQRSGGERHTDDDLFHAVVVAADPALLGEIIMNPALDTGCRPVVRQARDAATGGAVFRLDLFATRATLDTLRSQRGLAVEIVRNASEDGRRRQKQVGVGDRFEGGRVAPQGLGVKTRATE